MDTWLMYLIWSICLIFFALSFLFSPIRKFYREIFKPENWITPDHKFGDQVDIFEEKMKKK